MLDSEADLSDAHIYLPGRESKTKKERKLQLPEALRSWLLHPDVIAEFGDIDRRFGSEPLFINPDATKTEAKRWCETSERNTIRRACTKAGVPQIAPNQLGRHFFASDVIAAGGDIYALKNWLGHADIKSTERYLDVAPQALGSLHRLQSGPKVDQRRYGRS